MVMMFLWTVTSCKLVDRLIATYVSEKHIVYIFGPGLPTSVHGVKTQNYVMLSAV
jgi:hypothetical protein